MESQVLGLAHDTQLPHRLATWPGWLGKCLKGWPRHHREVTSLREFQRSVPIPQLPKGSTARLLCQGFRWTGQLASVQAGCMSP